MKNPTEELEDSHHPQHRCSLGLYKSPFVLSNKLRGSRQRRLTDDGGVLWSVEGADDDEAETFVLLAVNDHIAGLQGGSVRRRGGSGGGNRRGTRCRGSVAAWGAVLCGH